ncbi:MAG: manganese-dependent inorganic pyrophosphatase [Methanosphaera stadtmanae]|nr:manganese-dependent inorganic pyrophosphatase [Methanosphaera stadtmanae]
MTVYVFGHANPDTDTITSAIVMSNFERELGSTDTIACRLGNINKETKYVLDYLKIDEPILIEDIADGSEVILVDHNNPAESIKNLNKCNILKVVDHHRVMLNTSYPLFYRAEILGSTQTVLYKLYKEYGIKINKTIATLMIAGIVSDTLLLKSPTTTEEDIKIIEELSEIAQIDYREFGLEMLNKGTDLSGLSVEELLYVDAKKINFRDVKAITNQINTTQINKVMKMKNDFEEGIDIIIEDEKIDLYLLLITDIIKGNSQVIVKGKRSDLFEKSFNVKLKDNTAFIEGLLSRKKQVTPIMTQNA